MASRLRQAVEALIRQVDEASAERALGTVLGYVEGRNLVR